MATQVYGRLDDDRIEQLDAECEARNVYRPAIVTEAVERHLSYGGDLKAECDDLKGQLADAKAELERQTELIESHIKIINKQDRRADAAEAKVSELETQSKEQSSRADAAEAKVSKLETQSKELDRARNSAITQRNKFKEKFEQAIQTNEKLIATIRELQSFGMFKRASQLKRLVLARFTYNGESGE